jgi:hypothetical protein
VEPCAFDRRVHPDQHAGGPSINLRWIVLGLMATLAVCPPLLVAVEPPPQTCLVARYSNNSGPGNAPDQLIRIINVGVTGTPLDSLGWGPNGVPGKGDVCANFYVFDNNQAMVACCSCRVTPNGLLSASVGNQLTGNALTGTVPPSGVVKILVLQAPATGCTPVAPFAFSDASLVTGFGTHLETTANSTFVTETALPAVLLGPDEDNFLSSSCLFVRYLGSGRGTCNCSEPGE